VNLVIWSFGHLVIWSSGHLVVWSSGHLVTELRNAPAMTVSQHYRKRSAFVSCGLLTPLYSQRALFAPFGVLEVPGRRYNPGAEVHRL
jgi:hypothetical protein